MIIDLPQAIDAASNTEASTMLARDVDNLAAYFGQFAPELNGLQYGKEIWNLYVAGELTPESVLFGHVAEDTRPVNVEEVMQEIESAILEEKERLRRLAEMSGA